MPAVMRASAIIEQAGVPAVAVGSAHFEVLGHTMADVMGVPFVPIVSYPGVPLSDTAEEFLRKVTEVVAPAVVDALIREPTRDPMTSAVADKQYDGTVGAQARRPAEIVFRGSLDQVHDYFLDRYWTDGLPIVPPTPDRVDAFLRQTSRHPDRQTTKPHRADAVPAHSAQSADRSTAWRAQSPRWCSRPYRPGTR